MNFQPLKQRGAQIAAAVLATAAALSLSACSDATAAAEQPLTRTELSARHACAKGEVVEWISSTEMQCLKEIP